MTVTIGALDMRREAVRAEAVRGASQVALLQMT